LSFCASALQVARLTAGKGGRVLALAVVSRESLVESAEQQLRTICEEREERAVLIGDSAGKTLVQFVDTFAPHVLVVCASEKSVVEKLLLGSCASHVLENAKCNVLIAR
jgi:nucleotide-binding universal stress UspA family protein